MRRRAEARRLRVPSPAMVVALAALVVALSGSGNTCRLDAEADYSG